MAGVTSGRQSPRLQRIQLTFYPTAKESKVSLYLLSYHVLRVTLESGGLGSLFIHVDIVDGQ